METVKVRPLPPQSTPPSEERRFYRPELDALRLFAFLMVFADHIPPPRYMGFLRAGGKGVCLFFLLSAYLITELLLREKERTSSVHAGAFFVRRILRIWPLYFLAIALAFALGHFVPSLAMSVRPIPWMLALATNFYIARYGGVGIGAVGPLWSLSVEEQFYLCIPTITKVGGRRALMFAVPLPCRSRTEL